MKNIFITFITSVIGALFLFIPLEIAADEITIQDLPEFDSVGSINDNGLILGRKDSRAVIANVGDTPIFVDGGLSEYSHPGGINNLGQVAGTYEHPTDDTQAFMFDPVNGTVDLNIYDPDFIVYSGQLINNAGQMFWVASEYGSINSRLYVLDENGIVQSITVPHSLSLIDVNDEGQIISDNNIQGNASVITLDDTGLTDVVVEDTDYFRTRLANNNSLGEVVGRVSSPGAKAVIWDEINGLQDLLPPGEVDEYTSAAYAINDNGLIALTLVSPDSVSEFAFYSLTDGLFRFVPPEIPEPSACDPGTFRVSTSATPYSWPSRVETLNESGIAIVRVSLRCVVGSDIPNIHIPAIATVGGGIQILPIPRGLRLEDLFYKVENEHGITVNKYFAAHPYGHTINNAGETVMSYVTDTWDHVYVVSPHMYSISLAPSSPAEMVEGIITFYEEGLADGTLYGLGNNPRVRDLREERITSALASIQTLIIAEEYTTACEELDTLLKRMDGKKPPDWLGGPAISSLHNMLLELSNMLNC